MNKQFIESTADDDIIYRFLYKNRFPSGKPICPKCGSFSYKNADMISFRCSSKICQNKFSVTVGTIMENTKLSTSKWICGIYLCYLDNKISSVEIANRLGILQKAAWYLKKSILKSNDDLMARLLLRMEIDIDEATVAAILRVLDTLCTQKKSGVIGHEKKKEIDGYYDSLLKYASSCLIRKKIQADAAEVVNECYLLVRELNIFSLSEMKKKIYKMCMGYKSTHLLNHSHIGILSINSKKIYSDNRKICNSCREELPIGEYYCSTNISTGAKNYNSTCKNCLKDIRKTSATSYLQKYS